ncbi:MAG: DUF4381 domain-containing protein [Gammaproteobacteria bacterium]|nr:DUF4381 domain-containing protein [Gammaproteobacteria bacterium]
MSWIHSISIDGPIAEALQRLRDIHEPPVPGWWPIPIGWWGVAILVLSITAVFSWLVLSERRKKAPYMAIRTAALRLTRVRKEGQIDGREYATRINLLFKELVVQVEGHREASILHGSNWLEFLAERFNEREFVEGVGRCLGSTRYINEQFSDSGLQELINKTLARVSPLTRKDDA